MQMFQPSLEPPKPIREYSAPLAILASLWLVLTILGCSKQSQTDNASESTAVAESTAATPPPTAMTTAPVTDANILAVLTEGNSAEITLGKLALTKSKSTGVKAFAKMMITDHGKMKTATGDLAKKLNMTPQPPANDSGPAHLTAELRSLNSAPNPMTFDSLYIDDAVVDHTNVLAMIKDFETKATAPKLKDALMNAEPIVQKHLDRAKAIQAGRAKAQPMAMAKKKR